MYSTVEAVLIGAGSRGSRIVGGYATAHPDELRFVAVAEPDSERRERFAIAHGIPAERRFETWEDLVGRPQLAPAAINTTNDATHFASNLGAMEAGYDVLTEKPMAATAADCVRLAEAPGRLGRKLWVFHEMRNNPFFDRVRETVRSGRLGDVVSVFHAENVSFWHMAHAFVRGNWSNSETSGPMILTKCCHDMDMLHWTLGLSPNPPKDTDGRREGSGRGWVRELQGRWPGVLG